MNDRIDSGRVAVGRIASGGALALYATFSPGGAQAAPIIVDIPDVDLLSLGETGYVLNIAGTDMYQFVGIRNPDNPAEHISAASGIADGSSIVGYEGSVIGTDGMPKPLPYASALAGGETIDGARMYQDAGILSMFITGKIPASSGEFNSGVAYLGLQFLLDDATHYGWVEIIGEADGDITLTRYGYETEERTAIVTPGTTVPEPATLALLIAGALGVAAMRRRQRAY